MEMIYKDNAYGAELIPKFTEIAKMPIFLRIWESDSFFLWQQ